MNLSIFDDKKVHLVLRNVGELCELTATPAKSPQYVFQESEISMYVDEPKCGKIDLRTLNE